MKSFLKIKALVLLLFVALFWVGVWQLNLHLTMWSEQIGESTGTLVGNAVGSYDGYVSGKEEGTKAGEEDGLSANDTTVNLQDAVASAGKLEILAAGVSLKNLNKIGDEYKSLYIASGEAIFTIDLRIAEVMVSEDGKKISITIPEPTLKVYLDQDSTQQLAETQEFSFTVRAEDGITAYLNSMSQSADKITDTIANYDTLLELARESAITQVTQLVSALEPESNSITVEFEK